MPLSSTHARTRSIMTSSPIGSSAFGVAFSPWVRGYKLRGRRVSMWPTASAEALGGPTATWMSRFPVMLGVLERFLPAAHATLVVFSLCSTDIGVPFRHTEDPCSTRLILALLDEKWILASLDEKWILALLDETDSRFARETLILASLDETESRSARIDSRFARETLTLASLGLILAPLVTPQTHLSPYPQNTTA